MYSRQARGSQCGWRELWEGREVRDKLKDVLKVSFPRSVRTLAFSVNDIDSGF